MPRRRSLRFRLTQLALELAGLVAVLVAVFVLSPLAALVIGGLVLFVAAQVLERVL